MVESTESSNRIEGVTAGPGRVADIVIRRTEPRDRSEQEIAGYRDALHSTSSVFTRSATGTAGRRVSLRCSCSTILITASGATSASNASSKSRATPTTTRSNAARAGGTRTATMRTPGSITSVAC